MKCRCTCDGLKILPFDDSAHFFPQKRPQRFGGGARRRPAARVLPTYGLLLSAWGPLSSVRRPRRRRSGLGRLGAVGDGLTLSLCKARGLVVLKAVTLCSVGGSWLLAPRVAPVTDVWAEFTWALRFGSRAAPAVAGGGGRVTETPVGVQTLLRWGRGGPGSLRHFPSRWPLFPPPLESQRAVPGATLLSEASTVLPQRLRFSRTPVCVETQRRLLAGPTRSAPGDPGARAEGSRPRRRGPRQERLRPALFSQGGASGSLRDGRRRDRGVGVCWASQPGTAPRRVLCRFVSSFQKSSSSRIYPSAPPSGSRPHVWRGPGPVLGGRVRTDLLRVRVA